MVYTIKSITGVIPLNLAWRNNANAESSVNIFSLTINDQHWSSKSVNMKILLNIFFLLSMYLDLKSYLDCDSVNVVLNNLKAHSDNT